MMESSPKARKPYERPTVTKLTPEQAKLKLLGHASMGNQGAKDLLELMFPDVPSKDSKAEKKGANGKTGACSRVDREGRTFRLVCH
jgi:hypothetical protein